MKKARKLIARWAEGVISTCDFCDGDGHVGLPSLRGTCPQCKGWGVVPTRDITTELKSGSKPGGRDG